MVNTCLPFDLHVLNNHTRNKLLKRYQRWKESRNLNIKTWQSTPWSKFYVTSNWPMQVKFVNATNATSLLPAQLAAYLSNPSVYSYIDFAIAPISPITRDQAHALLSSGIFEMSSSSPKAMVFCVPEPAKERFRLVQDHLSTNIFAQSPDPLTFTPMTTVLSQLFNYEHAISFDFSQFFHQFPLNEEVRDFFSFDTVIGTMRPLRMPMGAKFSMNIAQHVSLAVANQSTEAGILVDVYADNILFAGNYLQLQRIRHRFLQTCNKYLITIGDSTEITDIITHRGILINLTNKTAQIAHKMKTKLTQRISWITRQTTTWGQFRSLLSSIVYVSYALSLHKASWFNLFEVAAREARKNTHEDKFLKLAIPTFALLMRAIYCVCHATTEQTITFAASTVFTDASSERYGYIIIWPNGMLTQFGSRFNEFERQYHINEKEIIAVERVFQHHSFRSQMVHLYTDNTAVQAIINRTWSRSFFLNRRCDALLNIIDAQKAILEVHRITSVANPADPISRGVEISDDGPQLLSALRAQGWLEEEKKRDLTN
ncbi:MAG: hypothetical protein ACRDF4_03785 [Rhabdochlamydiaceae bacterium]